MNFCKEKYICQIPCFRRVASFLDLPLKDDDVSVLASHLSFDKMKDNAAVNKKELVEVKK